MTTKVCPECSDHSGGFSIGILTRTQGNMLHAPNFATFSLREKIDVSRNPELDEEATDKFEAFLRSMLQYRPEDRKSAGELATDPWLVIERRQAQDRGS